MVRKIKIKNPKDEVKHVANQILDKGVKNLFTEILTELGVSTRVKT